MLAAVRGDRGERAHGREVSGIELERAQVARLRGSQQVERDQGVALVGMRKGKLGMAPEQRLDVVQRLRGPIDALQAQRQGVACRDVTRGERHRTLEQAHRVVEPALLLEARRQHVEEQRMLEPFSQRLLGDGRGAPDVAVLGMRQNRGQHGLVGLKVACHAGMMPEPAAAQKNGGPKPAAIWFR
ncbi:MAG TPA: hypothetical protein VGD47_08225 [Steroidobacteraceae bacterium]